MREKNKGGYTLGKFMLEYSSILNKKNVKSGQRITTIYMVSRIYTRWISLENHMRKYHTENQELHANIYHYYGFKEKF